MNLNRFHAVHYKDYASGTSTIVGLFRDENTAIMFVNDKNRELTSAKELPQGKYETKLLYTDIDPAFNN